MDTLSEITPLSGSGGTSDSTRTPQAATPPLHQQPVSAFSGRIIQWRKRHLCPSTLLGQRPFLPSTWGQSQRCLIFVVCMLHQPNKRTLQAGTRRPWDGLVLQNIALRLQPHPPVAPPVALPLDQQLPLRPFQSLHCQVVMPHPSRLRPRLWFQLHYQTLVVRLLQHQSRLLFGGSHSNTCQAFANPGFNCINNVPSTTPIAYKVFPNTSIHKSICFITTIGITSPSFSIGL
jgi:hypothetical protein